MRELDLEKVPTPVADCWVYLEVGALKKVVEKPDHESELEA